MIEGGKKALQTATFTADIPNCPHLKGINDLLATIISIYDVMPLGVGNIWGRAIPQGGTVML